MFTKRHFEHFAKELKLTSDIITDIENSNENKIVAQSIAIQKLEHSRDVSLIANILANAENSRMNYNRFLIASGYFQSI